MKTHKSHFNLKLLWIFLTPIVGFLIGIGLHAEISQPALFIAILISIILVGLHKRTLLQLAEQEQALRESLQIETAEKDRQTKKVIKSRERLSRAIRLSGIGHFEWSSQTGDCLYCSEQYAAHYGLTPEEFVKITAGREPYLGFVHDDDRTAFKDAIAVIDSGKSLVFEFRAVLPNGDIRFIRQINEPVFDSDGLQIQVVGCSLDLTDLREAEARVRQSQRIEAIGTLSGGIAHDFNNLLAIIQGNLELAQNFDNPHKQQDLLEAAIKATHRGASLTKNLLSFGRRAHLTPIRLNLNQHIQHSISWGLQILPESISIEHSLMADLWDTELDSTSLDNAIINILLNARDAMAEGGTITIKTANVEVSKQHHIGRQGEIEPGCYVMLAISDTGHGLSASEREKIFEPFYTKKPVGMGSGLGLSMVEGFIKQSGGSVRVDSEVDVGTTIKLFFKATKNLENTAETQPEKTAPPTSKTLEILIVEDDEGVAQVLRDTLEDRGYCVTTATSGDDAYRIFKNSNQFDLVITDVVMPGKLQGPALVKEIRLIREDIPCIFLSGYTAQSNKNGDEVNPADIWLNKPVQRSELIEAIEKAVVENESPYQREAH